MRRLRHRFLHRALCGFAVILLMTTADARGQSPAPADPPQEPADKPWWERITFFGDFRSRYEGFFESAKPARHRHRLRLRFGLTTPINDQLIVGVRLASGDPLDPTSANQSLSDFFTGKPLSIDQASATYAPKRLPGLRIGAGKFANPLRRTQVVWDDEVNYEGTWEQVPVLKHTRGSVRLVAVQAALNEVSGAADSYLFATEVIGDWNAGPHTIDFSFADYSFKDVDQVAVAFAAGEIHSQNTNLVRRDASGAVTGFVSGFHMLDAIASVTFATPRKAYPLTLLVEGVTNTRAAGSNLDSALFIQTTYGLATAPRTYALTYGFARIEQDAVLSPFAFSDIPASDSWMHHLTASAVTARRVTLEFNALLTKPVSIPEPWLTRIQVDARVRF